MKDLPPFARRAIRKNLCDRYGGRCAYCDAYVGMKGTVDHYVPQALGGQNQPHNLRWSCLKCNNLKGDMSPKDWEAKKPPRVQSETRYEKRIRLLSGIAQRGNSLWWVLIVMVFGAFIIDPLLKTHYAARCIEGHQFVGQTQVLDGEGRPVRCEGVRAPEGKPRS